MRIHKYSNSLELWLSKRSYISFYRGGFEFLFGRINFRFLISTRFRIMLRPHHRSELEILLDRVRELYKIKNKQERMVNYDWQ